jgi:hypothetical protein
VPRRTSIGRLTPSGASLGSLFCACRPMTTDSRQTSARFSRRQVAAHEPQELALSVAGCGEIVRLFGEHLLLRVSVPHAMPSTEKRRGGCRTAVCGRSSKRIAETFPGGSSCRSPRAVSDGRPWPGRRTERGKLARREIARDPSGPVMCVALSAPKVTSAPSTGSSRSSTARRFLRARRTPPTTPRPPARA